MYKINIANHGSIVKFNNSYIRTPFKVEFKKKKDFLNFIYYLRSKSISFETNYLKSSNKFQLGCFKDRKDKRDYKISKVLNSKKSILKLPEVLSYSKEMLPIKEQGVLGSCVGFAVTAVKEWQEKKEYLNEIKSGKKYRRKTKNYDLSEQWTYYKAKEIDPWPNEEGTSIREALKQVCKYGIPPEKAWVYNDKIKGKPKPWAKLIAGWTKGLKYYRINNLNELLIALNEVGPVIGGIICFSEIFNVTKNGIVNYPKNPDYTFGGHAIAIVGYDMNKKLIKFKNSWGRNWGYYGFGYLPFKYIEDFMIDAWALIDQNIRKL